MGRVLVYSCHCCPPPAVLPRPCWLSCHATASCLPAPPHLVCLSIASRSPSQLLVALPLVAPPPPLVAPWSLVHLTHGSHRSRCLLSSLPPIVSWPLTSSLPPIFSLHLLLSPPPSGRHSFLAGRLIVMLLRRLPSWLSSCCSPLCCPLCQGLTSGGPCPCI
jgi:hypothetical protein